MPSIQHDPNNPDPSYPVADERHSLEHTRQENGREKQSNGTQEFIDRCLVNEPAFKPGPFSGLWPKPDYFTTPTRFSKGLVDAISSVVGLRVLSFLTGVVVLIVAIEHGMSISAAGVPAGCAAVLAPIVAITTIRVVDLVLRIALVAIVVVVVAGLNGLVGEMFFGR